jgi:kinesin family protein 5
LLYAKEVLQNEQGIEVDLSAQFVEIYNEKATDLFTGKSILIRRDTGEPAGATSIPLNTVGDAIYVLQQARSRQRYASTEMNEHSSRSHTAFIINITQTANHPIHLRNKKFNDDDMKTCTSKLYLVDLAGSERIKKSKATGVRLQEAVGINESLLTIGKVISALVEGRPHVPYLESKLTTLLRNSFGGNCKTTVFINCRPDEIHADETLQSMRFGERCSMVLNATKHAATSKSTALETIDKAIERVSKQLQVLKGHGKENKETYHQLLAAHNTLVGKRKSIEVLA